MQSGNNSVPAPSLTSAQRIEKGMRQLSLFEQLTNYSIEYPDEIIGLQLNNNMFIFLNEFKNFLTIKKYDLKNLESDCNELIQQGLLIVEKENKRITPLVLENAFSTHNQKTYTHEQAKEDGYISRIKELETELATANNTIQELRKQVATLTKPSKNEINPNALLLTSLSSPTSVDPNSNLFGTTQFRPAFPNTQSYRPTSPSKKL